MNVGDTVRRSNSWHWLAVVAALSAVASAFIPGCGWKDAFAYRRTMLEPRVRKAQETLDALKALDESEAADCGRKLADVKAKTERMRAEFDACGIDPVPAGDGAVFAAQGRVAEALTKRGIKILSNEASVKGAADKVDVAAVLKGKPPSGSGVFKASEIEYKAVGDFRDIFMFLVEQTHRKPNYALKDIAVRRGDGGMDFSFTLRVLHR